MPASKFDLHLKMEIAAVSNNRSNRDDTGHDSIRHKAGRLGTDSARCRCVNCIVPPHILRKMLASGNEELRDVALRTLIGNAQLRGERNVRTAFASSSGAADGRRTIFDCKGGTNLPAAVLARSEDGPASADASVNRAFDGFGTTYKFYKEVLGRNSIDARGMRLNGYVHRGVRYNNAFWDGQQMVFGDGDGTIFTDFTMSLDVIAHELAHGVTQFTAGLDYHNQPGALNESISDVFGSLVKQWSLNQTADAADWKIGVEVFTPMRAGDALRSMKDPGKAYDNPEMGRDPQPDHMSKYVELPDNEDGDFGGVHINSGIPNKAFYLTAINIGGQAWQAPGHIWYESLKASTDSTEFAEFADTTYLKAGMLYGTGSNEQRAVHAAWGEVGLTVSGAAAGPPAAWAPQAADHAADGLAEFSWQIKQLSAQVNALAKDVNSLKKKQ